VTAGRFERRQRLLKPTEFKRVFARASRWKHPLLTVLWRPNGLDRPRLGLAVSKRQLRTAVARNRFKRQVRESFRQHSRTLGPNDIVVMARAAALTAPNSELAEALAAAWEHMSPACESSSSG